MFLIFCQIAQSDQDFKIAQVAFVNRRPFFPTWWSGNLNKAAITGVDLTQECSVSSITYIPVYKVKASYKTPFTTYDEKIIPATSLNIPLWSGFQCTNEAREIDSVVETELKLMSSVPCFSLAVENDTVCWGERIHKTEDSNLDFRFSFP